MKETFADYGIELTKASGQIKSRCPMCGPSRKPGNRNATPLSVNVDDGVWKCHHCSWEGCLRTERKPEHHHQVVVAIQDKIYDKPKYRPAKLPEKVISWFAERAIPKDVLDLMGIGWGEISRSIMFPYLKSGQVINIKSRTLDKKFKQCSNAEKSVYNYDAIRDTETVFTEGEMDVLACVASKVFHTVSLPDGSGGYTFWENVEERFKTVKRVVIWTDNDEPGYRARFDLAKRIGYAKCLYVQTPDDCSDANEVLQKYGPEKVRELIKSAKEFPIDGVVFAGDLDMVDYLRHGLKEGLTTGIRSIDPFWKFAPDAGELVIGTGYPGSGKSDFFLEVLVNQAKAGYKSGIFSPEESPLEDLVAKLIEKSLDAKFCREALGEDEVRKTQEWVHENFFFHHCEDDAPNIDDCCVVIEGLAIRKDIRFFLLDPWNELDHSIRGGMSETEWINNCLGKLRRLARKLSVTIIVVAHPTKPRPEDISKDGNPSSPSSWAIAGSAAFRNKSDVCVIIHRPEYGSDKEGTDVEIRITKVKKKRYGCIGTTVLTYKTDSGKYFDLVQGKSWDIN